MSRYAAAIVRNGALLSWVELLSGFPTVDEVRLLFGFALINGSFGLALCYQAAPRVIDILKKIGFFGKFYLKIKFLK